MDYILGLFLLLFVGFLILKMSIENKQFKKYLKLGVVVSAITLVLLFTIPQFVQDDIDLEKHDELNTFKV